MDFIALDVETANADLSSICQIGLVQFRSGDATQRQSFLVDPRDYFDPINVSIHGITASDVAGAPTFADLGPTLWKLLSEQIVVHHTAFDRVAIYRASSKCAETCPECRWLDSARVARRAWERYAHSGYGLENVARDLGIKFDHHEAVEDAYCAGMIVLRAIAETGVSLNDWLGRALSPLYPHDSGRVKRDGSPDGPLAGEVIAFTGALHIPRREAADLAAAAGCDVGGGVTSATTILVVGDQDVRHLNGKEKSAKHLKAEKLIADGHPLRIIGESDFAALVSPAQ